MNQDRLLKVLLSPHVSEKSSMGADLRNQHVFRVLRDANKREIRQAVEALFNVKVVAVQVMNVRGKNKRFAQMNGRRPSWKKAVVRITEGQDIDFAGSEG
jgi:large subunit ribosomal protein L23